MCIIVDTNTFSLVFKANSNYTQDFRPVLDWVIGGKGKFVIGGTKYLDELKQNRKALSFLNIMRSKTNKVIILNKNKVDEWQIIIQQKKQDSDFDDPHLPAMVIVSRCLLICSLDKRSIEYVTSKSIYPKNIKVPKYYTGIHNVNLLCDKYIDKKYFPLDKLNKRTQNYLLEQLE